MSRYTFTTSIEVELDDGALADCLMDIEVETYPAEPYSWGGSRGTETDVSATLSSLEVEGDRMTRAKAVEVYGAAEVGRIETIAAETVTPEDVA